MKTIVCPFNQKTKELITLARYEMVDYFVDKNINVLKIEEGASLEYYPLKKVYPIEKLCKEEKESVIIIVADESLYSEYKSWLINNGFEENKHFFNGWNLDINYYKRLERFRSWQDFEGENVMDYDCFSGRAKILSELVNSVMDIKSVMDIGCGNESLKRYLRSDIKYYGVDYKKRSDSTIICDLNKESLPNIPVDAYYMAGLMTYIDDIDSLFAQMKNAKYIIFNIGNYMRFLRLDFQPQTVYAQAVNKRDKYLSFSDIFNACKKNGFIIEYMTHNWNIDRSYLVRAINENYLNRKIMP